MNTPRYRVLERLGGGGMGIVYRAEDTVLKRPVALKFLAPAFASDEEYKARFLREARMAAALNHPNTCVVHEVGRLDETFEFSQDDNTVAPRTPLIVMEFIEGETLATRLARLGPVPVRAAIDIARQVAEGLAAAHALRIVHRDLKPHNVMVTADGRVKIVDFGLAKPSRPAFHSQGLVTTSEMISADMGQGTVVGTCAYMSPEQAAGKSLDTRSDVFSFGIMLYEMLSGRLPFRGDTATEIIAKILEAEPEPLPATVRASASPLEHVIRRCLEKRPADRYEDASRLLDDLRSPRAVPSALSRMKAVWRTAVVLFAVVLALWGLGWRDNREAPGLDPNASESLERSEPLEPPASVTIEALSATSPPILAPPVKRTELPDVPPAAAPQTATSPADARRAVEPAPHLGKLAVTSAPRASVSLDGDLVGVTPLTLETSPGRHDILLTGPDDLRWLGRIDVVAGQNSAVHRDLTAVGSLSVVSDIWADVRLDDGPPEQTPIHFPRVPTGLHRLQATREGYVTQALEVFIEEGKTTSLRLVLDKQ